MVGLVGELRQVAGADHGVGLHHGRRPDLLECIPVAVEPVGDQRPQQAGTVAPVHHEHGARHAHGALSVEDAELLTDLPVRPPLVGGDRVGLVADDPHHHVVVLGQAVGSVGRRKVRDVEQQVADLHCQIVGLVAQSLLVVTQRPAPILERGPVRQQLLFS